MYAIYFSDHYTKGELRLFGVTKYEVAARELAQVFSFSLRWDRYVVRYCRSPYLERGIPPFAVYCYDRLRHRTHFGFFKIRDAAQRLADNMAAAYPGISFFVRDISFSYAMRAPYMDTQPTLF